MKRYRFEAAIQRSTGWGAFVFFPHDTQSEFGIKGRVPIQARLGGLPYTGSLMPRGEAFHLLAVPQAVMEQLGKKPGDLLEIDLCRDDEPRTVELPEDFAKLLRKEKLLADFEKLTLTRRKEYRKWIMSAKREDTRQRRLAKAVETLRSEVKARA
jgi:hypothetical protein